MEILKFVFTILLVCNIECYSQDINCLSLSKRRVVLKELIELKRKIISTYETVYIPKRAKYKILFKEIIGEVQHFPHAKWEPDTCIQNYPLSRHITFTKLKSKIETEFEPSNTTSSYKLFGKYLVVSFFCNKIGSQTSWKGVFNFYYELIK
jgi:hypothetical protein